MAIDASTFRDALSGFAAGVTVITTVTEDGTPAGLTATAFTSVSLEPPLVLVCVAKTSESFPAFQAAGFYGVNILAADQQDLSNRFAKSGKSGADKFDGVTFHRSESGVPLLSDAKTRLVCRIVQAVDAGDHGVFIAEVEHAEAGAAEPLLYYAGAYRALQPA